MVSVAASSRLLARRSSSSREIWEVETSEGEEGVGRTDDKKDEGFKTKLEPEGAVFDEEAEGLPDGSGLVGRGGMRRKGMTTFGG